MNLKTDAMLYTGDPNRLHIPDGLRASIGVELAEAMDELMRRENIRPAAALMMLCPGCFMIAGFNMLVTLADRNDLSREQLADFMISAFQQLKANPDMGLTEEITDLLDPE